MLNRNYIHLIITLTILICSVTLWGTQNQGIKPGTGIENTIDVSLGTIATVLGRIGIETVRNIGATSLVSKTIPDWSIAIGSPAKVVRSRKSVV